MILCVVTFGERTLQNDNFCKLRKIILFSTFITLEFIIFKMELLCNSRQLPSSEETNPIALLKDPCMFMLMCREVSDGFFGTWLRN